MITDTHTHLYAEEFNGDREALIKRAITNNVKHFYLPNIDSSSIGPMLDLETKFPENCFPMMGLHPCSVNERVDEELAIVEEWLAKRRFAAIGEIGLDLYWDKTFIKEQQKAFRIQIDWALQYNYSVSIHCREAFDPIYDVLSSYKSLPKAIFHCFSGTLEQAEKILAFGNFKLGIGGVVTFKNAGIDKVVSAIDMQNLVLETDAPYLAPAPFRGKRNEPMHIIEIAKKVAELKDLTIEEVGRLSSESAEFIFKN